MKKKSIFEKITSCDVFNSKTTLIDVIVINDDIYLSNILLDFYDFSPPKTDFSNPLTSAIAFKSDKMIDFFIENNLLYIESSKGKPLNQCIMSDDIKTFKMLINIPKYLQSYNITSLLYSICDVCKNIEFLNIFLDKIITENLLPIFESDEKFDTYFNTIKKKLYQNYSIKNNIDIDKELSSYIRRYKINNIV